MKWFSYTRLSLIAVILLSALFAACNFRNSRISVHGVEILASLPTFTPESDMDIPINHAVEYPALRLKTYHQKITISINGYTFWENPDSDINGFGLYYISLPANVTNQSLRIRVESDPFQTFSNSSNIYYGSLSSLLEQSVSMSLPNLLMIALLFAVSMLLLAMMIFLMPDTQRKKSLFWMGISLICWSLYSLCLENISYYFLSGETISRLHYGFFYNFPIFLTLFAFYFLEKTGRYLKGILTFQAVLMILNFLGIALNFLSVSQLYFVFSGFYLFLFTGITVLFVFETCHYRSIDTVHLFSVLLIFGLTLINEIMLLHSDGRLLTILINFSFLFFIAYTLTTISRRIITQEKQAYFMSMQTMKRNQMLHYSSQIIQGFVKEQATLRHELKNHLLALLYLVKAQHWREAETALKEYAALLPLPASAAPPFFQQCLLILKKQCKETGIAFNEQLVDHIILAPRDLQTLLIVLAFAIQQQKQRHNSAITFVMENHQTVIEFRCPEDTSCQELNDILISQRSDYSLTLDPDSIMRFILNHPQ